MPDPRCPHRLPPGNYAGYGSREDLAEAARKYPHLRPCALHDWHWIYRTSCEFCPELPEHQGPAGERRAREKKRAWLHARAGIKTKSRERV